MLIAKAAAEEVDIDGLPGSPAALRAAYPASNLATVQMPEHQTSNLNMGRLHFASTTGGGAIAGAHEACTNVPEPGQDREAMKVHKPAGDPVDREEILTAFPDTEIWLRRTFGEAKLDVPAFRRSIVRCDLAVCRGMCCYDGVYVDKCTASVLKRLAAQRAAEFNEQGVTLPASVTVKGSWRRQNAGLKTATRQADFRSRVEGFPQHFNDTACIFLCGDGRCSLQNLGVRDGKHPWFYKPVTCWLHPIDISPERITLYSEETDPLRYPDYDGYVSRTLCGRTTANGQPAYQVLRPELEFLGRILGRDLLTPFDSGKIDPG